MVVDEAEVVIVVHAAVVHVAEVEAEVDIVDVDVVILEVIIADVDVDIEVVEAIVRIVAMIAHFQHASATQTHGHTSHLQYQHNCRIE